MRLLTVRRFARCPGALIGTELMAKLPARVLRRVFAVFLILVAARMLLVRPRTSASPAAPQPEGAIAALGAALVDPTKFLLPFEVASVLLLVALVGAVIIARER